MMRKEKWPEELHAYIEARRNRPFTWGANDCCQFARRAIEAMRGGDPARGIGLRPYRTHRGALAQLQRIGGIEALPAKCGLGETTVPRAKRGDLMLGDFPRPTLGICVGQLTAFPGGSELVFMPTLQCRRAWIV